MNTTAATQLKKSKKVVQNIEIKKKFNNNTRIIINANQ